MPNKLQTLKKGGREANIIRLKNGFDDGRPLVPEDVGAAYDVAVERIREAEAKAFQKPDVSML